MLPRLRKKQLTYGMDGAKTRMSPYSPVRIEPIKLLLAAFLSACAVAAAVLLCAHQGTSSGDAAGARMVTHQITLTGSASGGTLYLVEMTSRRPTYISIETRPGESANSVAKRLARKVEEENPFGWSGPSGLTSLHHGSGTIECVGFGGCVFAGSETGLGIPGPPTSLSASYNAETKEVKLRWENPPQRYDTMSLGPVCMPEFPPSNATQASSSALVRPYGAGPSQPLRENPPLDKDLWVVGWVWAGR